MHMSRFLVAAILGLPVMPPPALAGGGEGSTVMQAEPETVAGELLVRFADDVPESRIEEINARFGVQVINRLLGGKLLQVRVSDLAATADIMALYAATPGVLYAEPNFVQRIPEGAPGTGGPEIQ